MIILLILNRGPGPGPIPSRTVAVAILLNLESHSLVSQHRELMNDCFGCAFHKNFHSSFIQKETQMQNVGTTNKRITAAAVAVSTR